MPQVEMILFLILIIGMCVFGQDPASKVVSDRYAVFWNRTNPSFPVLETLPSFQVLFLGCHALTSKRSPAFSQPMLGDHKEVGGGSCRSSQGSAGFLAL
ncbi:hypothetical protein ILYODFUR_026355 [Ilyodon furcidens]|uniref:Uncharacterized protein n=1 Tax=Ilyodon furcidens TaxID=33524 RepID=A0ABV0T2L2_9TELE